MTPPYTQLFVCKVSLKYLIKLDVVLVVLYSLWYVHILILYINSYSAHVVGDIHLIYRTFIRRLGIKCEESSANTKRIFFLLSQIFCVQTLYKVVMLIKA